MVRKKKGYTGDYCVYLIAPEGVQGRLRPYIGCTNDPRRRIRQHNRKISGGAKRTHGGKWRYIIIVSGFVSQRDALQFEWQAQRQAKVYGANLVQKRRRKNYINPSKMDPNQTPFDMKDLSLNKSRFSLEDMVHKNARIFMWLLTWSKWTHSGLPNKKRDRELTFWWIDSTYMPPSGHPSYYVPFTVEHISFWKDVDFLRRIERKLRNDCRKVVASKNKSGDLIIDLTGDVKKNVGEKSRYSDLIVSLFSDDE